MNRHSMMLKWFAMVLCGSAVVAGSAGRAIASPVLLSNVPAYKWYHGCGPTAVASIIGYYDLRGCDNLFTASGWNSVRYTVNVQDQISSPAHNAKYDPHPDDSSLPTPPNTSIACWFQTSVNQELGWSKQSRADEALEQYAKYRGYSTADSWYESYSSGAFTWTDLVGQIDAGRPMMFLVDSSGDGGTDHFVPVLGYDDRGAAGKFYACYTTWTENETVNWYQFRGMSDTYSWGVAYGTFFSIPFTPPNGPPVAVGDVYSLSEDGSLSIGTGQGVLANDTDPEGSPLTAVQVTNTAHGTITLYSNGSLEYTPIANYHGTDSFTYKANDGVNDSNAAVVTLTIASINDAPIAEEDSFSVAEGGTLLRYSYEGILKNDVDVDLDDTLTAELVSGTSHGLLEFYTSGALKYMPEAGFAGTDSFVYRAFDGEAYSDPTTVWIDVIEAMRPILGDATGDGRVDEADARVMAGNWGQATTGLAAAGDFNEDGVVNAADASILAANWGNYQAAESAQTVPEPACFALLAGLAGALGLARRRPR